MVRPQSLNAILVNMPLSGWWPWLSRPDGGAESAASPIGPKTADEESEKFHREFFRYKQYLAPLESGECKRVERDPAQKPEL